MTLEKACSYFFKIWRKDLLWHASYRKEPICFKPKQLKRQAIMIQNVLFFIFDRLKVSRSERISMIFLTSLILLGSLVAATVDPTYVSNPIKVAETDSLFRVLSERRLSEEAAIMERYALTNEDNKMPAQALNTNDLSATKTGEKSFKSSTKKSPAPNSISLNMANASELTLIPGIGPKTADAIIHYRNENGPFSELSHIVKVKGIGPKKWEQIRPYLRL